MAAYAMAGRTVGALLGIECHLRTTGLARCLVRIIIYLLLFPLPSFFRSEDDDAWLRYFVAYLPADASTAAAPPAVTTAIMESTSSTSMTSTNDGTTHTTSTATSTSTSTSVPAIPPSSPANTDAKTATREAVHPQQQRRTTSSRTPIPRPRRLRPDAAATGDSATATDGSNATAPPPAATAGTDSQTQTQPQPQTLTTVPGVSAAVPTISPSGTGSAANESSSSSSSFLRAHAFIGALAAVSVLLALLALFLVLRCRRRRARARARGHKLDAEMDAAFRSTVSNEKEKALEVERRTRSPPLALAGAPEHWEPQYNFFAQQRPYSAAPDHAHATPYASRRGSAAYLASAPMSANSNASGGREPDEPAFEMITPAVAIAVSPPPHPQAQAQAQAYPHAGPACAELHRRPTVTVLQQPHAYLVQEHAHQSGLEKRSSLTAVIHLSRPASPVGNPFEDAPGAEEEQEQEERGRAMTEIPLSPPDAYPNPYGAFAA
ncbi:hypothetical protein K438DRAFT_2012413 [Mycena galopus ATCC 62051]|nr:hypothetical protein K438DRAFT_2012413 [Mycena galopus ATCC 62051]